LHALLITSRCYYKKSKGIQCFIRISLEIIQLIIWIVNCYNKIIIFSLANENITVFSQRLF
jgi:hypothetical protein